MASEKKFILIILILVTIIGFIFFTVINPSLSEIKKLSENIKIEKENFEASYQRGKTISQLKKEYKEVEDKKSILENIFLTDGKELEFITSLEKIASRYSIREDINLAEKINFKNNYKLMPINLRLRGGFQNLIKYFDEIEHLNFYLNADSLNINTLNDVSGQIEISLIAKTYWQKNQYAR